MKTARFSNKNLDEFKHIFVRISRGFPKFKLHYKLDDYVEILAPSSSVFQQKEDYELYRESYIEQLENEGTSKIAQLLNVIQHARSIDEKDDREIVLLCFEDLRKPNAWCHRRIFAEWWQEKTGEIINELQENSLKQPFLF